MTAWVSPSAYEDAQGPGARASVASARLWSNAFRSRLTWLQNRTGLVSAACVAWVSLCVCATPSRGARLLAPTLARPRVIADRRSIDVMIGLPSHAQDM